MDLYNCNYCNCILFTKLPRSGDSEGTFWSSSQAATCPSVHHARWRLHPVSLVTERQAGKLWITIFIVFGLIRPGIELVYRFSSRRSIHSTTNRYLCQKKLAFDGNDFISRSINLHRLSCRQQLSWQGPDGTLPCWNLQSHRFWDLYELRKRFLCDYWKPSRMWTLPRRFVAFAWLFCSYYWVMGSVFRIVRRLSRLRLNPNMQTPTWSENSLRLIAFISIFTFLSIVSIFVRKKSAEKYKKE